MDKGKRIECPEPITYRLPERMQEPLKKFLYAEIYHYNRADMDTVRESVIAREYLQLCRDFCYLNDCGIHLGVLRNVSSYACVLPFMKRYQSGDHWQNFNAYLAEHNASIEIVPDQTETPQEDGSETAAGQ